MKWLPGAHFGLSVGIAAMLAFLCWNKVPTSQPKQAQPFQPVPAQRELALTFPSLSGGPIFAASTPEDDDEPVRPIERRLRGDEEPAVDLLSMPSDLRRHNITSKGLGCCVFRSADYMAGYLNIPQWKDFPEWMKSKGIAGGGYPEKFAKLSKQISADRGMPEPKYIQVQSADPSVMEAVLKTGRPFGMTWNANHMLNGVGLTGTSGMIVDNNRPNVVQVFSRSKFLAQAKKGGSKFWLIVPLKPRPPMPPTGRRISALPPGADRPIGKPIYGVVEGPSRRRSWRRGPTRYSLNGRAISRMRALELIRGADTIPDDGNLPSLTAYGPSRDRIAADLQAAPALAPYRSQVLFQSYDPSSPLSWPIKQGHKEGPGDHICMQMPDGQVLMRLESYPGPDGLAVEIAEGMRRRDPNYNPNNDPKPGSGPSLSGVGLGGTDVSRAGMSLAGLAAASGVIYLFGRRKE